MKICLFQGTFNPIHKIHLKMADYVIQNYNFDKVIFIPAFKPPHKKYDASMAQHRFNMVKLATKINPRFAVSDIEYKNNKKSYTYPTVKEIYEKENLNEKINFIIGTDAFEKIETWYETNKLKDLVKFIVFKRDYKLDLKKFDELKSKGYDFTFADMTFEDISSTQIRNSKDITNLVPDTIKEYIIKNELYNKK